MILLQTKINQTNAIILTHYNYTLFNFKLFLKLNCPSDVNRYVS